MTREEESEKAFAVLASLSGKSVGEEREALIEALSGDGVTPECLTGEELDEWHLLSAERIQHGGDCGHCQGLIELVVGGRLFVNMLISLGKGRGLQ